MGKFIDNAITDAGRILLADVQIGATFTPTKIVIGSGKMPPGTTARTISAVVTPVIELAINKKERANDGTVVIGGIYSNETIREDFYFRELALFAKAVKADGSPTQEVLYSYGNAGELADLMPAYTSGSPVERQIDLVTYIGNDTKVDVTVTSGMYISKVEKGAAGGVATLDSFGKVPVGQLPSLDFVPTSDKGKPNGVATLDNTGKVPAEQMINAFDALAMQKGNKTTDELVTGPDGKDTWTSVITDASGHEVARKVDVESRNGSFAVWTSTITIGDKVVTVTDTETATGWKREVR
nr:MAG TPA: tail-collar fiber protein [Caudoviricetes sp.]